MEWKTKVGVNIIAYVVIAAAAYFLFGFRMCALVVAAIIGVNLCLWGWKRWSAAR